MERQRIGNNKICLAAWLRQNAFDGYDTPTTVDNEELYFRIVQGEVRVQPTRMGDMDGNGRVTSADATLLARHLVGHYVTIDRRAADVNCDGVVNTYDLIRLARALVGHFPTICPSGGCARCL
ncbi:MAG: dockerin type I repeat-containing protein [Defluviitaleaceae bacterium]|nr:dockerin type I repeat-containing protein [Defluviitaleaceae bacterium]MCL2263638.1 dockerin type I repeat-containing protein [Defluviitaleaceae bacterium]